MQDHSGSRRCQYCGYFIQRRVKLRVGDTISLIATPIAKALKLPCIDPKTGKLKLESGCAKRRDALNRW
jgi:hypothetical protein